MKGVQFNNKKLVQIASFLIANITTKVGHLW